jgi:hypothetical protein
MQRCSCETFCKVSRDDPKDWHRLFHVCPTVTREAVEALLWDVALAWSGNPVQADAFTAFAMLQPTVLALFADAPATPPDEAPSPMCCVCQAAYGTVEAPSPADILEGMRASVLDGGPDRIGDHYLVVSACGHCGDPWSRITAPSPYQTAIAELGGTVLGPGPAEPGQ